MMMLSMNLSVAVRTAIAGLLTVLLVACAQDTPEKLMASARDHLAKGDRAAAVIQLRNLLKTAPDNGEARLMLGQALLDADDFASAEKELGRAIELKQPEEKVLPAYTRALLAQGKYEAVVAEVEKRRLYSPQAVAETQSARGEAYFRLGKQDLAQEAFAAALTAVPGYPRARLGRAVIDAAAGRLDDAIREADAIVSADGKFAEARMFRARLLLANGDRAGAAKALEETIATSDRFVPARLALIGLRLEEGNLAGAAKLIEETRRLAPGNLRLTYLESAVALRNGDTEKARQKLQQVLKYSPEHVPSLVLAGGLALQQRQFAEAESHLRKAIGRAPDHAGARGLLVQTYLAMGQPAKARDALQPLIAKGVPDDPRLLMLAGETYLANGDVQRANSFYQAATKSNQDAGRAAARTRLGEIALATGRLDEGVRELEAAALLGAGDSRAELRLVALHLQRREFDKATEAVDVLAKKQPENPLAFQLYGAIALARGDAAAARRSFDQALALSPTYLPAAYQLAQFDLKEKKPDAARKRYEAMIAKEPKNEYLIIALAQFELRAGVPSAGVAATLRRAVQANPQAAEPRLLLIQLHLRNGDVKAAVTEAQAAVAAMPSEPVVLEAAGIALEAGGEINQAIEAFNKLAAVRPQDLQPLYRLAALYSRQGENEKAIDSLRRAQKIAPNDVRVARELVLAHVKTNRFEDAFKEARTLQKREPKVADGWALEGDIDFAQLRFDEAARLYGIALKLDPGSGTTAVRMHASLSGAGKRTEADAFAKSWVAQHPKDPEMRVHLGGRALAAGDLKAAAAHFQAAIAVDPNDVVALNNLAWIGGETGDPKALDYAERGVRLAPNNPTILDTYGTLLLKRGEAKKGFAALDRARALAPTRADLRLSYAKALIRAGRKEEARKELEALQGVKGNFPGKDEVAVLMKKL